MTLHPGLGVTPHASSVRRGWHVDRAAARRYDSSVMIHEISALLEALRGTDPSPEAVGAAADRIAAAGPGAVAPLLKALEGEDEAVLGVAAASLRRLASPALTQRLVTLLRSPRLGDLAKALVLGILEDAGMDITDPSLMGAVADLEGLLLRSVPAPQPGAGSQAPEPAGGNGGGRASGEGSR